MSAYTKFGDCPSTDGMYCDAHGDPCCDWTEELGLKEYAMDHIDTYTSEEIAQMVREGVLTIEEVETGLRRRIVA